MTVAYLCGGGIAVAGRCAFDWQGRRDLDDQAIGRRRWAAAWDKGQQQFGPAQRQL